MSNQSPKVVDRRRFMDRINDDDVIESIRAAGSNETVPVFSPSSDPNRPTGMDFCAALKQVMTGARVTRLEWGNPEIWLMMHMWGTVNPKTPPGKYLSIHRADGTMHPLFINDGDLIADDWIVIV